MDINIQVFHHFGPFDEDDDCEDIDEKLDRILQNQAVLSRKMDRLMAKVDDLNAELESINQTTNELAADVDALLAQAEGGLSAADADAHVQKLKDLKTALQAVASKYPVSAPVDPPAEGGQGFRGR